MKKLIEELKKLNTKNLLRFYKAERKRMFQKGYRNCIVNEDEFGEPVIGWNNSSFKNENFNNDVNRLTLIKKELYLREHINKN